LQAPHCGVSDQPGTPEKPEFLRRPVEAPPVPLHEAVIHAGIVPRHAAGNRCLPPAESRGNAADARKAFRSRMPGGSRPSSRAGHPRLWLIASQPCPGGRGELRPPRQGMGLLIPPQQALRWRSFRGRAAGRGPCRSGAGGRSSAPDPGASPPTAPASPRCAGWRTAR